ncbi:hypothetical protein [Rahnella woolbedingensis]|uniref:hypothetical protein n=1 Tax=Rahnella woolbedingensis TaxID=1510574 RepID=UPI00142D8A04|nr:hypothetical protein [Rahnella woolbedingensis]
MSKTNVKVVLLSSDQLDAIKKIQEQERIKSPLGVAPTIHVIARGLMDKALEGLKA